MNVVRPPKAAPAGEALPPALRRNPPLVPVDSAELVGAASAEWQSSVGREMTIQVRPTSGRDVEADVARVAAIARGAPGVAGAEPMGKAEAERLLEPWL